MLEAGQHEHAQHSSQNGKGKGKGKDEDTGGSTGWTGQGGVFDTALGIAVGTTFLGLGGVAYFQWYKWNVLRKMEIAFKGMPKHLLTPVVWYCAEPNSYMSGGYDPVLELEKAARAPAQFSASTLENMSQEESQELEERIRRDEQDMIDKIIKGQEKGHYYLLLGPKGAGKTSMMIQAVSQACSSIIWLKMRARCWKSMQRDVLFAKRTKTLMCSDFALAKPSTLNTLKCVCLAGPTGRQLIDIPQDSYNGLFQRRDPKEAGPMLDIERAMSKLEKVAIRYRKRTGRPLVLVFNNMHFLKDDEAGQGILHLIQQRAESWAASQCANIVINSDDFRIYDLLSGLICHCVH